MYVFKQGTEAPIKVTATAVLAARASRSYAFGSARAGTALPNARLKSMSIRCVVEESFFIAWSFLEKTGELGQPDESANVLLDAILAQVRRGERRKLMLANMAIASYRERAAGAGVAPEKEARRG